MSRMSVAQARLSVRKGDTATEDVTYSRASVGMVATIRAEFGRRAPSRASVMQLMVNLDTEPMDFLIDALDFAATPFGEPNRGDRITTAAGEIYEVTPRDGEPHYRKSDEFGHRLRLRTIRVT